MADRPVTQQGVSGMRTSHQQGPERSVRDTTYWFNLLHQKIGMITKELQRMQVEIGDSGSDKENATVFERR